MIAHLDDATRLAGNNLGDGDSSGEVAATYMKDVISLKQDVKQAEADQADLENPALPAKRAMALARAAYPD